MQQTLGVDPHPRPQLERSGWISLNGHWEFALDPDGFCTLPEQVNFDRTIRVPFAPETSASGVQHTGFFKACWYRRQIKPPALTAGQRVKLCFGAVDYSAEVFVNDRFVTRHEGGNTPFAADITDYLQEGELQTIVVRAIDDPADLAKPRGKQDWQLEPHSIWYPRTSGIWQTVWLEVIPETSISYLRWTPNIERWEISVEVDLRDPSARGCGWPSSCGMAATSSCRRSLRVARSRNDAADRTFRSGHRRLSQRIAVVARVAHA